VQFGLSPVSRAQQFVARLQLQPLPFLVVSSLNEQSRFIGNKNFGKAQINKKASPPICIKATPCRFLSTAIHESEVKMAGSPLSVFQIEHPRAN
jgi:hypothetical protein